MELIIKQGYKQTEVGLIPEDWSTLTIEEVANVIAGGTPSTSISSYWNGDIEWFTPTEISGAKYSSESVRKISKAGFNNCSAQILPKGAILMTTRASIGDLSILLNEACTNQGFQSLISKKDVDNEFLYYLMQTKESELLKNASGSTFLEISPTKIKAIRLPFPPTLTEQKAIATALSDVDELINSLELLITKKKAIKQGAMQQLLTPPNKGGKRLPGFDGEWERKEVQKFINVGRGGSPRPIQDYITTSPDGVNWIKIGDTSKFSKYITYTKEKIIKEGENLSRSVKAGDFLLSNSMSFGRPYILKIDGCIHDGWLVLQDYQNYFDIDFLYYTLMSKDVFDQYLSKASGSGVLNLNKELVKVVELNRPKDLKEQVAIATILSDMDKELEELATKKQKYQGVKQGMMQELLTGKTRLV
jgi:type I restriction enzyme S subunit